MHALQNVSVPELLTGSAVDQGIFLQIVQAAVSPFDSSTFCDSRFVHAIICRCS